MKPNTIRRSGALSKSQIPRQSNCIQGRLHWLLFSSRIVLLLLVFPPVVQAQFSYTTNNGTITITGYTGPGGAVMIPAIITGLPVTSIGDNAFSSESFVTSISWATNIPVVVEACTILINPIWSPISTNTLTAGSSYFSDPQWSNYASRFYRLRSP